MVCNNRDKINKKVVLLLAERWENEAVVPDTTDGRPEAVVPNAMARGARDAKRKCAEDVRALLCLL